MAPGQKFPSSAQWMEAPAVLTGGGGGGGGAALAREDDVITTASLANGASEQGSATVAKATLLLRITGSAKCRVRLYSTAAYRAADIARAAGTDPVGEHGIMTDILFPDGNLTWDLSPLALLTNGDTTATTSIYYTITNLSGATAAITVTLTHLPLEV